MTEKPTLGRFKINIIIVRKPENGRRKISLKKSVRAAGRKKFSLVVECGEDHRAKCGGRGAVGLPAAAAAAAVSISVSTTVFRRCGRPLQSVKKSAQTV